MYVLSSQIIFPYLLSFLILLQMAKQPLPSSKTSLFHQYEGEGFYLAQFSTPQLAIFSYYLESQSQAYLIDPTYDVYPYKQLADKRNAKIISILLTHYHADYVAGHTQFNLPVIMGPKSFKEGTVLKVYQMQGNSTFNVGSVWIKILHTPGHTMESTCFELIGPKHNEVCLFTGDTIFLGEVGRPDLAVSSNATKEDLAKMLFHSIQKVKKEVNHSVRLYPTHGSGSACGKNISQGNFCTLQTQMTKNYALKIENEEDFIQRILSEMPKPPSYFFHDAKLNQSGTMDRYEELIKSSLKFLTIEEFKTELDQGSILIDSRHDLGGKSIKNSYLMSENGMLATWVGTYVPPDTQLVLFCNKDKANDLVERLLRIGYYKIKGCNGFTIDEWQQKGLPIWQPKSVNAKIFAEAQDKTTLDVRNLPEWEGGIVEGAKLISLPALPSRHSELQGLANIYIHCRTGMRARLACSILAQKGISSTIVADKFEELGKSGAKIVGYQ